MIKIDGLTNITPEELNHLSIEVIPKLPLALFNKCLRILNLKSMGVFMCNSQEIDIVKEADKVLNKIPETKNPFVLVIRFLKFLYAISFFLILFNYINLKWFRFFLKNSNFQNDVLANQFYVKLERSQRLFFFGRLYFRKARKLKVKQQSLKELTLKLNSISPKFHLRLTSEQDLFHKFTIRLYTIGAIRNVGHFKEAFNGFVGNQVDWYFDKESIIFMIESMNLKDKIRMTDRSKDISICFFNAKDGLPFDHDDLNTVASRKGLSKFNSQKFQKIINNPSDNDIPKIYSIYKEIYRS